MERDIIHAYTMSDGYIRKGILTIDNGEDQKEFVEWLYDKLAQLRTETEIRHPSKVHPETKKRSYSYRFNTRTFLHGFHFIWYKPAFDQNGKPTFEKRLPKDMRGFFTATTVAVWYAGDGTKIIDSSGVKFEVTSFTLEERNQLQSLFWSKFGIVTNIISSGTSKKGTPQWALKVPAAEYPKFYNLITKESHVEDLFQTVFAYKLPKYLV